MALELSTTSVGLKMIEAPVEEGILFLVIRVRISGNSLDCVRFFGSWRRILRSHWMDMRERGLTHPRFEFSEKCYRIKI